MSRRTPEPDAAGVVEAEAEVEVDETDSADDVAEPETESAVEAEVDVEEPPAKEDAEASLRALWADFKADRRAGAARAADPALHAAGQVRRRPGRRGPAAEHRAGRPGLVRHLRADRRDREVRPRARDQVRDLRDQPDPWRDHRRAAAHRLDPALGALQGPRGREGLRRARGEPAPHADGARGRRASWASRSPTCTRSSARSPSSTWWRSTSC